MRSNDDVDMTELTEALFFLVRASLVPLAAEYVPLSLGSVAIRRATEDLMICHLNHHPTHISSFIKRRRDIVIVIDGLP